LEIFADDVVCSHGATIGEIDEHQLFYLVSRGIPIMKARSMLIKAFLVDTLSQIRVPQLEKQAELQLHNWVSTSNQLNAQTA
jgi:Fe-S cluster assembly protein SufD